MAPHVIFLGVASDLSTLACGFVTFGIKPGRAESVCGSAQRPRTHPARPAPRPAPVTPLPPGGRSVALLTPLLTAEMRAHPAWRCWVKLVEVHSVFILHELTVSDIERLDDLQLEHAERFANVPEYAGLTRPKLHFLSHIAQDVWRYAPPPRFVVLRVRGI